MPTWAKVTLTVLSVIFYAIAFLFYLFAAMQGDETGTKSSGLSFWLWHTLLPLIPVGLLWLLARIVQVLL